MLEYPLFASGSKGKKGSAPRAFPVPTGRLHHLVRGHRHAPQMRQRLCKEVYIVFSAHQTTVASLVFGGEHCIPSCSWRLSLVLRSLCGCRIRTVVQCWPLSVIVVSKESVNYYYSYGYHDWIELLKPDFCGKYVIIQR